MFTNRIASYYSQDKVLIEAACLSTDTKPTTGVANGSKCIEMDTGKKYMFNEEDSEWEELPSSGGGGGSSDFSTAQVTIEGDDDLRMTIPFIMTEADGMPYDACACITSLEGGETYSIPLYKGKTLVSFNSSDASTIEVSGNIQYVSDISAYLITGDCTITIS